MPYFLLSPSEFLFSNTNTVFIYSLIPFASVKVPSMKLPLKAIYIIRVPAMASVMQFNGDGRFLMGIICRKCCVSFTIA